MSFNKDIDSFIPITHKENKVTAFKNDSSLKDSKLVQKMTVEICNTFEKRNPLFRYDKACNPKRVLTKPSLALKNDGYDNENADFILYVHGLIGPEYSKEKYSIIDMLGAGTFGQVARCRNRETDELVAIKVIKNKPAYTKQSLIEVEILNHLNRYDDPDDEHNIIRLKESFVYKQHLCIVFELLSVNLYELIKQNHFKGLSTNLVRVFSSQILDTLQITKSAKIIHCDLKPENILLRTLESPAIKVIDFGSACYESQQAYSYIQSRFYRSPEVLLGVNYTTAIDMWSFGCIVAELFLGLPLFPGSSEYNQLSRIIETAGDLPDYMIANSKYGYRYYNRKMTTTGIRYYFKSLKQYSEERSKPEKSSKRYFSTNQLNELVLKYPMPRKDMTSSEIEKEMKTRRNLLDFLKKVLHVDPLKRLTPKEAASHPFISGETTCEMFDRYLTRKNKFKRHFDCESKHSINSDEEEDNPYILAGVRRKSFAKDHAKHENSVSPIQKYYGSVLNPLLSPPLDQQEQSITNGALFPSYQI
ncbi:dual specificity protein kinase yak1 [Rhizopus stolonifer]|uniref:Dual specificity protein kinase yak1 n=1 Tax=Rhizopus stolonifer TaxID=4846 RepID=A0A367JNA4_RHIST|nr:dual specificity protein kinase yak1 [Rhizopus stolonifer]